MKIIKKSFIVIVMLMLIGCNKNNKELEKDINSEITEYIKETLNDTWDYSDEKFRISNDHSVEMIYNNMEDWSVCALRTKIDVLELSELNTNLMQNVPTITFICKNNGEVTSKAIYKNIANINKDNIKENMDYYDANGNIIEKNEEEEYKKTCVAYKYKEIFRNPDDYIFKRIKITGEVIQVMEEKIDGEDYWVLRVNMTKDKYGFYDDTIMVMMKKRLIKGRIIEDDIFTFYGELTEPVTYETVLGASQTVPAMVAYLGNLKK